MRVLITQEFQALSLTGEKYTVEEYTYFEFKHNPHKGQRPHKKMFCLKDPRPAYNFQQVDHVSGDVYEIRLTKERIARTQ